MVSAELTAKIGRIRHNREGMRSVWFLHAERRGNGPNGVKKGTNLGVVV
jgi:hypothetical protein